MQIQSDHMVDPSNGKKIGNHSSSDGAPMALFLRLSRIWEITLTASVWFAFVPVRNKTYGMTAMVSQVC
jgi:hypothetical protein